MRTLVDVMREVQRLQRATLVIARRTISPVRALTTSTSTTAWTTAGYTAVPMLGDAVNVRLYVRPGVACEVQVDVAGVGVLATATASPSDVAAVTEHPLPVAAIDGTVRGVTISVRAAAAGTAAVAVVAAWAA